MRARLGLRQPYVAHLEHCWRWLARLQARVQIRMHPAAYCRGRSCRHERKRAALSSTGQVNPAPAGIVSSPVAGAAHSRVAHSRQGPERRVGIEVIHHRTPGRLEIATRPPEICAVSNPLSTARDSPAALNALSVKQTPQWKAVRLSRAECTLTWTMGRPVVSRHCLKPRWNASQDMFLSRPWCS